MVDKYIEDLKSREDNFIIEVLAFMSYNPSIGRVLEKGGVIKFKDMALNYVKDLNNILSKEDFDRFHNSWVQKIIDTIQTNGKNPKICSYGQAQKAVNVFLKLYCDWSSKPDCKTAKGLRPFLHVPLDSIMMSEISKEYPEFYKREIKPINNSFSLSKIEKNIYDEWQKFFRRMCPDKPLIYDLVWAKYRK